MSLNSEFSDFKGTQAETFKNSKPENRQFTDVVTAFQPDIPIFRPKKDDWSHIRLIPWPKGLYFARESRQHKYFGPANSHCPCPIMKGGDIVCPLCNKSREAWNMGNEELGKNIGRKIRYNTWCIDRKNAHLGPQLFEYPEQSLLTLRGLLEDAETGAVISVDDLEAGYDLYFKWRKETSNAPYYTINDLGLAKDPSPLGSIEQIRPWMDYIRNHPWESIWNYMSDEKMLVLAGLKPASYDDGFDSAKAAQQAAAPVQNIVTQQTPSDLPPGMAPPKQQPVAGVPETQPNTPAPAATQPDAATTAPSQPAEQAPVATPAASSALPSGLTVEALRASLETKAKGE